MSKRRRLFMCDPSLSKLENTFRSQRINDVKRYAIVEGFLTSFAQVREVIQLMSVSEFSEGERDMVFSKTVFVIDDEDNFKSVTDRIMINADEYYDKILEYKPKVIESRMRIVFDYRNVHYVLDYSPFSTSFALVEVEYDDDLDILEEDMFFSFPSVTFGRELDMSFDEVLYRRFIDKTF